MRVFACARVRVRVCLFVCLCVCLRACARALVCSFACECVCLTMESSRSVCVLPYRSFCGLTVELVCTEFFVIIINCMSRSEIVPCSSLEPSRPISSQADAVAFELPAAGLSCCRADVFSNSIFATFSLQLSLCLNFGGAVFVGRSPASPAGGVEKTLWSFPLYTS